MRRKHKVKKNNNVKYFTAGSCFPIGQNRTLSEQFTTNEPFLEQDCVKPSNSLKNRDPFGFFSNILTMKIYKINMNV